MRLNVLELKHYLLPLIRSALLIARRWVRGVRHSCWVDECSVTAKPGKKWRHLERHFVARRSEGRRRGLDQFRMVVPGVELDASAQRQGSDLVQFIGIEGRSRVHQHNHAIDGAFTVGEAIPQMGSEQRGKRPAPNPQLAQEEAGGTQLLGVR